MAVNSLTLARLRAHFRDLGVRQILLKFLSPNDNSKNQVYLGGDLGVVNIIPAGDPIAGTSGSHAQPIFKASVAMSWLDDEGRLFPAPFTQLILYPQYPEVRLSGFLRGAERARSDVMTVRDAGRVMLFGLTNTGTVIAYAALADSVLARELRDDDGRETVGVFQRVALTVDAKTSDARARLLTALCRINGEGWIDGWALNSDGTRRSCIASNCVGVTLESELGITANGRSDPDFEGWEVKAHTVSRLDRHRAGVVTLMTPEPTDGFYAIEGAEAFVRHFGYPDRRGREDRLNFGGIHLVGIENPLTRMTLALNGFDADSQKLTDSKGQLALVSRTGLVAAAWSFAGMLAHWKRKHARAVFVPALKRKTPTVSYRYGNEVVLAEGTDYIRLLSALASGAVYYDPGIKVENASTRPKTKRRSQFRVKRAQLDRLYHSSLSTSCCDQESR